MGVVGVEFAGDQFGSVDISDASLKMHVDKYL